MIDTSSLFVPLSVGELALRNRIVMSPMTRRASPAGVPTEAVARYYARRAEGGVGLIVTEGVGIDHPASVDDTNIPVLFGEAALQGWKEVVAAVHEAGAAIFPQLWHMGPMLKAGRNPAAGGPMRPSGLWGATGKHAIWGLDPEEVHLAQATTAPMSQRDIDDVLAAHVEAARSAKAVGFDGIAIHGAHGYLPDAFLWEETNRRTDGYGGDPVARTRFIRELVAGIRGAVGAEMPIMLRFSQWKQQDYHAKIARTPAELEALLAPISAAGVDIFDASTRRFWQPEFEGSELNLAGWTQKITGKPTMTIGSVALSDDLYGGMQKASSQFRTSWR